MIVLSRDILINEIVQVVTKKRELHLLMNQNKQPLLETSDFQKSKAGNKKILSKRLLQQDFEFFHRGFDGQNQASKKEVCFCMSREPN